MARSRRTFRPRDITAAMKAVKAAGLSVSRVDISAEGIITVYTGSAPEEDPDTGVTTAEEWERFEHERFRNTRNAEAPDYSVAEDLRDSRDRRNGRQWQDLGLPRFTAKILAKRGIHTLPELAELTDDEMLKLPGFGPHSLDAVHRLLKKTS